LKRFFAAAPAPFLLRCIERGETRPGVPDEQRDCGGDRVASTWSCGTFSFACERALTRIDRANAYIGKTIIKKISQCGKIGHKH